MAPQATFYRRERLELPSVSLRGSRYSGFQVTVTIAWGQNSKAQKIPEPKIITPEKSHAEFPGLKIFQKAFKNDMT